MILLILHTLVTGLGWIEKHISGSRHLKCKSVVLENVKADESALTNLSLRLNCVFILSSERRGFPAMV
jgi:hypothetical protein